MEGKEGEREREQRRGEVSRKRTRGGWIRVHMIEGCREKERVERRGGIKEQKQ